MRWWIPALIIGAAIFFIGQTRSQTELEEGMKNMRIFQIVALSFGAILLWFLFFTSLRWWVRLTSFAVLVAAVFGVSLLIRVDGSTSGAGGPRIVWKWTPALDSRLPDLQIPTAPPDAISLPTPDSIAAFPEFLGPGRSNVILGAQLETNWSAHPPQQLWRQPIGLGWSAFAVAGTRAITQEQRGPLELVVCYNLLTGTPAWAHTNHVRFAEQLGGDGPRATPTIHDNRVYALGATGLLDCLDLNTGKLLWSRDTLKELQSSNLTWGKSSSPLLVDDLVVISGGSSPPGVLAYKKDSGDPAWRAGDDKASYASPVLATLAGQRQILSVNAASLSAHHPETGAILWSFPWATDKWPKASQPVPISPDLVFISAGYGVGCALLKVRFESANPHGLIEVLWQNRSMKTQFTNVAIKDNHIYGIDDGLLACVEISTGKRIWKDGRFGSGQLLRVDNFLLIQAEAGHVVLVEANPIEYRELARLPALQSKTWNNPTLASPYLLVRNDTEAICYQLPQVR